MSDGPKTLPEIADTLADLLAGVDHVADAAAELRRLTLDDAERLEVQAIADYTAMAWSHLRVALDTARERATLNEIRAGRP